MADPAMAGPMVDAPPTDDQGTDQPAGPNVLLTVLDLGDGTYKLIEGDEDEDQGTGGDAAGDAGGLPSSGGMGAGASGSTVPSGMGSSDGSASGAGQTFDSIGSLMKGILDVLQKSEAGADGSEDDNFDAGYSGASTGAPTMKQPPAMMRS